MSGRAVAHENTRHWTVPEGRVAVLVDFSGLMQAELEPSEIALLGPFLETIYQSPELAKLPVIDKFAGGPFQWSGRAAFYENEVVTVLGLGGLCDFYLTGYLLHAE